MSEDKQEKHFPLSAELRDKTSPVWDMSQERAFIENLLGQRFNFFLVFFSLTVAGSVNAKAQIHLQIILGIGAIISILFALVLARSQEKLDLILADLRADETHPATIIDRRANPSGSRRRYMGIWIPRLCCSILVIGCMLAWSGKLSVPQEAKLLKSEPKGQLKP